jgi:hypothetical protein
MLAPNFGCRLQALQFKNLPHHQQLELLQAAAASAQ